MKKRMFYMLSAAIVAGSVFTSCESKQEKVEDAKEEVQEAKEDLNEAQRELNAEYPAFRTEYEEKIAENQRKIDRLRDKVNEPGNKPLDDARLRRINTLEEKNAELRARLYGYENERSDWEEFKREFKRDMDELGNSFENLGKDNAN